MGGKFEQTIYILLKHGPPELFEEAFLNNEDSLVAEIIVSLNKEAVS